MSATNKPSFKVDGKTYELEYTRALQREYKRMTDEKKQDKEYQRNIAEYYLLQSQYEKIHAQYEKAAEEFFADVLNEDKERAYNKLAELNKAAFDKFNTFASEHNDGDGTPFTIDCLERLVILALKEQYNLSTKDAEAVWCKYVTKNGEKDAILFLSFVGSAWFTDTNNGKDSPFVKSKMAKVEAASNRRIGLQKINK